MIQKKAFILKSDKTKLFYAEARKHAASKEYWEKVKSIASTPIDAKELDKAYSTYKE